MYRVCNCHRRWNMNSIHHIPSIYRKWHWMTASLAMLVGENVPASASSAQNAGSTWMWNVLPRSRLWNTHNTSISLLISRGPRGFSAMLAAKVLMLTSTGACPVIIIFTTIAFLYSWRLKKNIYISPIQYYPSVINTLPTHSMVNKCAMPVREQGIQTMAPIVVKNVILLCILNVWSPL